MSHWKDKKFSPFIGILKSTPEDKRFSYSGGIVNFTVTICTVWGAWYIFMHPNGVCKLYTPMYGFSLVIVLLASIIFLKDVAEYYPFLKRSSETFGVMQRGILLTAISLAMVFLVVHLFFGDVIGRLAIAYFSPESIVAAGGAGAEPFVARENASTAIIYITTVFIWIALFWRTGFGNWPCRESGRRDRVLARFLGITALTVFFYSILFHPHICYIFYPAQTKAAVPPWWEEFALTGSAFFNLGLVLCIILWLVISEVCWEGYPWKIIGKTVDGSWMRGMVMFITTAVLGAGSMMLLCQIMNRIWDEPFIGGQYTDGPDFRYIHAGEIAGFFILAAYILKYYFNNFPNFPQVDILDDHLPLRALLRTLCVMMIGISLYGFYYSNLGSFLLGKVPGVAQPGDTPLVWTLLFLCIIMFQFEFFEQWPLQRNWYKDD